MSSKPAGVRDEWLHVIALLDKNDHERTPHLNRSTICEDKVLQLVSLNDATEYSYLENETLQRAVEKFQLVSFISTLSAKELSTFCGMFSSDEEIVLAAAQQNINDQSLTSLPSKQLIELVCIILECECSDVLAQFSDLSCIVPFLKRTETLLSMGGDDRLTINFAKDKLNKYMSSTIPRVDMLNRGSCTCSTISLSNYELAERERRHFLRTVFETASLCQGEGDSDRSLRNSLLSVFDTMQSQLMDRIRRVVGLSSNESGAKIVLFPSGSDAEYLPLVAALVRSHELADGDGELIRVINYVCAAGEVGSGTAAAASGKHFSALPPRGDCKLAVDSLLEGIHPKWVSTVQVKPRAGATGAVSVSDSDITARVRRDLLAASATTTVAVLHVVCGSKTGLVHPSFGAVSVLQQEFGRRLIVVVDACQLRCEMRHFASYTAKGYMTLFTGSKFFTAPPFAGAVILPAEMTSEIESHLVKTHAAQTGTCVVPPGLNLYLTGFEVLSSMPQLRAFLSEGNDWLNLGLHLRWACGVRMMERYAALPAGAVEDFTRQWAQRIRSLVAQHSPYLRLLPDPSDGCAEDPSSSGGDDKMHAHMAAGVSGIVSIVLSVVDKDALDSNKAPTAFEGFSGFSMSGNAFKRPAMVVDTPSSSSSSSTTAAEGETTSPPAVPMRALDFDQCKEFHRLMTLRDTSGGHTVEPAVAVRCMLGQPVKLADNNFAVVRITLGADMVVDALENAADASAALEILLREDDAVVTKMSLLARNWHSSALPSSPPQELGVSPSVGGADCVLEKMKRIDQHLLLPHCPLPVATAQASTNSSTSVPAVSQVLQQLYPGACPVPEVAIFYDLDAVDCAARSLKHAFTSSFPKGFQFAHCFAIKSAPLTYLLHHFVELGLGLETASLMEVKQALRSGCAPHKVVFDSPCKTVAEIDFALRHGVQINANSFEEVKKIDAALKVLQRQRFKSSSVIGLRVNPMVGAGKIDALSTATATSKFGVPCAYADQTSHQQQKSGSDVEAGRVDLREQVITTFLKYPFLRGIMCHVGSQGMPLESMVQGARTILDLADEIDTRCSSSLLEGQNGEFPDRRAPRKPAKRITHVDIGGGLSANYDSDDVTPTFLEYAQLLAKVCGDTLSRSPQRVIVTEFGKALITKSAAIVTRVEECIEQVALAPVPAVAAKAGNVKNVSALVQTGADLLLRTCYASEKFPHRIAFLDQFKQVLTLRSDSLAAESPDQDPWCLQPSAERNLANVTVAGPLCFSGDVLGRNLPLPEPVSGDICLLLDTGANTLSLFSRHCSRLSSAVYAFRRVALSVPPMGCLRCAKEEGDEGGDGGNSTGSSSRGQQSFVVACIREKEKENDLLEFWG